jgi:hypothetical protein
VQADEIQTTTQTIEPVPLSQPQVVDSYMKPTVTQTKTVTTSDGNSQTSTAPMVMERHERVVVPTSEVVTTTTKVAPKVTSEVITQTKVQVAGRSKANRKYHVAHKARRHVVAHRHAATGRTIAFTQVRKTTTVEPRIIQQTQTVEQKGVVVDRRDPALDQN